jgi:sugar diacid utilization regulator
VATATDLLGPGARLGLRLLAGPSEGPVIYDVAAVESLAGVASSSRGSLVVVMQAASTAAPAYEVDVAIRHAADHGLAALLLVGRSDLPLTSVRLAERARLPVLTVERDGDVAELLVRIDRTLRGGASDTLARARAAVRAAQEAEAGGDVPALLRAASAALGVPIALDESVGRGAPQDRSAGVHVHGRVVGRLRVERQDEATELALPTVAAAVGRMRQAELEKRFAPGQTRAELLTQILVAERTQLWPLAEQARQLGLPIDDTHVAVTVQVDIGDGTSSEALVRQRRVLDTAELTALQTLPSKRALWHVARLGASLLLLCTERTTDGQLAQRAQADVQRLLDSLVPHEDAAVFAGIGTTQRGVEGIRQSAMESRAATESAQAGARRGVVVMFDGTGLRRILVDVSSSPLSRRLIAELLAPLDEEGPARSRQSIQTLAAYLDAQSSPTQAARVLHLHPNAVSYRIRRITELLRVDLTDADTRFTLHLACRTRLLDR